MFEIEEIWATELEIYDQSGYWTPPDEMSRQSKSTDVRQLYRWNARDSQTVTPIPFPAKCSVYMQATVYHCNSRFWVVPYDATHYNVRQQYPIWKALKFDHLPNGVSSVSFAHEEPRLATQHPNQTWREQLFPDGYWANQGNNQPGGLQGDLAVILALAAFSAPRGQMANAINTSFKVGRWQTHNLDHGRE